jgi:hypothetical protein
MKIFNFLLLFSLLGVSQNSFSFTMCSNNPSKDMAKAYIKQIDFDKRVNEAEKYTNDVTRISDFSPSGIDKTVLAICKIHVAGSACYDPKQTQYKVDEVRKILTIDFPWYYNSMVEGKWYMGDWLLSDVRASFIFDMVNKKFVSAHLRDLTLNRTTKESKNINDYPYEIQGETFLDRKNNIFWVQSNSNNYIQYANAVKACQSIGLQLPTQSQLSILQKHISFCDRWPGEKKLELFLTNGWYIDAPTIYYPNHIGYPSRVITKLAVCVGNL